MIAPSPPEETLRIRQLREAEILDTAPERTYDAVVELIAQVCDVPIAAVSLVDECRQWFKAKVGLSVDETPRDWAFCAHAILEPRLTLVVPDATLDRRFVDNPLVTGPPGIRFYAGYPLLTAGGQAVGTLCVIDCKPRSLAESQIRILEALANHVASMIETRAIAVRLRKSEATRRETEHRFALMADDVPVMLWTMDTGHRIQYVNRRALSFSGKSKEEFHRCGWNESIHPEDAEPVERALSEIRNGIPFEVEVRVRDANGGFRWLLISGSPRPLEMELYAGFVGSCIDITERKRMQEEFEKTARLKSEFLSNMSHEIRTPMNVVIGMGALLRDTELTDEQFDYVETINKGAESLLGIINGVLDFSKLEAGKMEPDPEDFNIDSLTEDLVEFFSQEVRRKGLGFTCHVGPDVPEWAHGDKGRLRQILTNLISNAIKFTETGLINLDVNLVRQTGDTSLIRFEVRDTGIGIAPEVQEILFQAFTQADGSTTRKYGGSGLGLAISKRLTEMMGGRIDLESQLGSGSRFSIQLPFQIPQAPQPPIAGSGPDLAGVKALVVEGIDSNRDRTVRFLTSWLATVECAENGSQAIQKIREKARAGQPYGVVILDIAMPGISGIDIARLLALDPANSSTPVIMLTSPDEYGALQLGRDAGVKCFLTRPVRRQLLRNAVLRAMRPPVPAMRQPTPEGRPPAPAPAPKIDAVATSHGPSTKILLVEDNRDNQKLVTRLLQKHGFSCDLASNGREAVERIETESYALILMDCQMPIMDGFQATRMIREREMRLGLRVPILALTAHALPADRERCLEAGMDDYLSKPINAVHLVATLRRWISPT